MPEAAPEQVQQPASPPPAQAPSPSGNRRGMSVREAAAVVDKLDVFGFKAAGAAERAPEKQESFKTPPNPAIPATTLPERRTRPEDMQPSTESEMKGESVEGEAASEEEAAEPSPPEDVGIRRLKELAAKLEEDPDLLYQLMVDTKIDGVDGEVTIEEMRKSYQTQGHVNRKSMELSREREALVKEHSEKMKALDTRLAETDEILKFAGEQLMADYANVNWNELRATDPVQYNATWIDAQRRAQDLKQRFDKLGQAKAEREAQRAKEAEAYVQSESLKLLDAVPEWRKAAVRDKQAGEMTEYAKASGFTDAELSQLVDHRHVVILRKAMLYDALQKDRGHIEKKVREAPKMTPQTNRDRVSTPSSATVAKAKEAFMKSRSIHDAVQLMRAKRQAQSGKR